ncbi:TatD related DNase-like protein [Elsinoe fawcettii]|nr:TatD related DNase-like protein [Elsinoe fawcettii]
MSSLPHIPQMRARVLTVMSTRAQDQDLVANAASSPIGLVVDDIKSLDTTNSECTFLPSFGWHPWFSHLLFTPSQFPATTSLTPTQKISHYQSVLTPPPSEEFISSLPSPISITSFLTDTRTRLLAHPMALVGEIGLDRSFHLPERWDDEALECRDPGLTPGGREGRRLSKHQVTMEHQKEVMQAQLRLAGELRRGVSVHGVRAPGFLFDALAETWKGWERKGRRKREKEARGGAADGEGEKTRPFPQRICLHSYSGPAETVGMYLDVKVPAEVFFSFSVMINFEGPQATKAAEALRRVPDDRVLVESDLHTAGDRMDNYLEEGVRRICKVKGWGLEEGVKILGRNWKRFVFGDDILAE